MTPARYAITLDAPGQRPRVVSDTGAVAAHVVALLGALTEHRGAGVRLWVTSPSAFVGTQYTRWTCEPAGWRRVEAFETPWTGRASA